MNIPTTVLSTSVLIIVLQQAVTFSRVTSCRQEAWLKSTELLTHLKIDGSKNLGIYHSKCRLRIFGKEKIAWKEIQSSKIHHFNFRLQGKL